ncbi:tight adherence protein C [Streptomyces sp. TLI_235]|nr:DUF5936 domain-containing protein [Streptomyces sp. TLI_235]PBC69577.1 tight adherence protein C [Streptomyces sp. TLI_235]
MDDLWLPPAAAACFVLLCWGWRLRRTEPTLPPDLTPAPPGTRRRPPSLYALAELIGRRLVAHTLVLMGPRRIRRIRGRLERAGTHGLTVERYAARRAGLAVLGTGFALLCLADGSPVLAALILPISLFWADITLNSAIGRRRQEIERTLPDFLDVLTVTVSAGLGFRQALERVAERQTGPLGEEIATLLRQMELGMSRRTAFEELRRRNPSGQLGMFVTALLQAEELGSPLGEALLLIASDIRREAAQSARRRAARAVPQVSAVVTLVLLPATVLLLAGALFVGSGIDISQFTGGNR